MAGAGDRPQGASIIRGQRLTSLQQAFATTSSYSWQFDAAGNITRETSPDGPNNFSLDGANELTGASLTSATSVNPVNETYAYDANGNRNGGLRVTSPGNRLVSDGIYTYLYDAEGNRTAKFIDSDRSGTLNTGDAAITLYSWDPRNRLVGVVTYAHQGDSSPTETLSYPHDYADRLIASKDSTSSTVQNTYTVAGEENGDKSDDSALSGKRGTTSYQYDPLQRLTQITNQNTSGYSSGITTNTVNFAYNDDSTLNTITRRYGSSNTLVATTGYRTSPTALTSTRREANGWLPRRTRRSSTVGVARCTFHAPPSERGVVFVCGRWFTLSSLC